jgi:hypothetical protein
VTLSLTALSIIKGIVVLLSVIYAEYCKQTHFVESRYANCRNAECRGAFFNAKASVDTKQEYSTHFM